MSDLLKNISFLDKQRLYYNGSHCIYCGKETEFVDSIKVYQESYGMIHYCQGCDAWVNCITGSDQSFGTVAKKALRNLRIEAHKWYDPLVEAKVRQLGSKRKQAQIEGRKWLSNYLDIDVSECHIGYFDDELCKRVIEKCKMYFPTPEQIEKRNADIQYRIDTVYFLSGDLDFGVKEFNINGQVQLEIKHRNGKTLYYNPVKKLYRWEGRSKPKPIDDIEEFILTHFKEKEQCQK